MDVYKVSIGKLVVGFGVRRLLIVDSQMPFPEFVKPVLPDKFVFDLGGRLVYAPRASLVGDGPSLCNQPLAIVESLVVQLYCHGRSPSFLQLLGLLCDQKNPRCCGAMKMIAGCVLTPAASRTKTRVSPY